VTTNLHPLHIRRTMTELYGRRWSKPEPYGPDGWWFVLPSQRLELPDGSVTRSGARSLIVSCATLQDPDGPWREWVHASLAGHNELPTYDELTWMHRAVYRDGYAYQVFAPPAVHVNIHEFALHLHGRLDSERAMPEFSDTVAAVEDGRLMIGRSI